MIFFLLYGIILAILVITQVTSSGLESFLKTYVSGKDFTVSYKNNTKVGNATVTIKGKKNTTVTFRFGEMLNDSGAVSRGNDGPKGSIYTANYRTAKATGQYIMKGAKEGETYRPNFTFFGFRYVEITADKDINLIDFKAEFVRRS